MNDPARKPASVLLIDDDARLLDALKRHFHVHRHECVLTTSPDAREAWLIGHTPDQPWHTLWRLPFGKP